MANWENQNQTLCLLTSVVIQMLIPAISIRVPVLILAPSFLLHTFSLLRDVYSCDIRIRFLFVLKSVCPGSVFRLHWIRYTGVSPLSEISGGWWKLSLLTKVRFPKPPWMSSTFYAFSRQLVILKLFALRIVIVFKIDGGCEANQQCLHRLRCFSKDCHWGKLGLGLILHKLWIAGNSNNSYRMEKWECVYYTVYLIKYLRQQLWKRGHFGMKESKFTKQKRYQRLTSKKLKSKSNLHRKTWLRKCWYPIVIGSELVMETLGLIMQCAIWRSSKEKLSTHTIRIQARSYIKKENNGFNNMLASNAYLRKASSNSLLFVYLPHYMAHKYAYVIICFRKFMYTHFVLLI